MSDYVGPKAKTEPPLPLYRTAADERIATLESQLAATQQRLAECEWLKVSEHEPPYGEHILIALRLAGGGWFICYGFVQSDWSLRSVDDECIGYDLDDDAYWRPVKPPIDEAMGRGK